MFSRIALMNPGQHISLLVYDLTIAGKCLLSNQKLDLDLGISIELSMLSAHFLDDFCTELLLAVLAIDGAAVVLADF